MKYLNDHNEEARKMYMQPEDNIFGNGAGVLCPKCGFEMKYSQPGVVLASYPPQSRVHCISCGHHDVKIGG